MDYYVLKIDKSTKLQLYNLILLLYIYFSFHGLDNGDKNNKYGMSFFKNYDVD